MSRGLMFISLLSHRRVQQLERKRQILLGEDPGFLRKKREKQIMRGTEGEGESLFYQVIHESVEQ